MPACWAWQTSVPPAEGQEAVYPGGAGLNGRGGGPGASTERARSQSCSTATGTRPPASSVDCALQALLSVPQGTVYTAPIRLQIRRTFPSGLPAGHHYDASQT